MTSTLTYVSIKYTERLAEAGVEPSVSSVGDSYDNALAETINGLYKAEVIHRRGPWRSFEAVEFATLEWVDWFNNRRLLEPIGNIPPAEAEQTGLLAALPFVFGGIGMVLLGQHSDRTMERKGHVAVALLMAAIGIGTSGLVSNPIIIMALLCFAQIGVSAVPAMFWPLPASFLTGASAAAGIAAINSLGNLSGFAGPFAMGYLKDLTGDFTVGLLLLAGCAVIGAAGVLSLRIDAKRERLSGGIALAN